MLGPEVNPHCLIDVSTLSEAPFRESVKSGEVLSARSIEPFEGGRLAVAADAGWWLDPL
jgi:hypothetical protein